MCTVYIHDPTDPDVEYYYDVGHYYGGVFTSDLDHREVKLHYWAFFNEPGIAYSELSHEELKAQLDEDLKELEKDIEEWRREHGLGELEC